MPMYNVVFKYCSVHISITIKTDAGDDIVSHLNTAREKVMERYGLLSTSLSLIGYDRLFLLYTRDIGRMVLHDHVSSNAITQRVMYECRYKPSKARPNKHVGRGRYSTYMT